MKPLGMTLDMRIIRPSPVEDKVWEAVREAIDAGWSPARMRAEIGEAWDGLLREDGERARKEFA